MLRRPGFARFHPSAWRRTLRAHGPLRMRARGRARRRAASARPRDGSLARRDLERRARGAAGLAARRLHAAPRLEQPLPAIALARRAGGRIRVAAAAAGLPGRQREHRSLRGARLAPRAARGAARRVALRSLLRARPLLLRGARLRGRRLLRAGGAVGARVRPRDAAPRSRPALRRVHRRGLLSPAGLRLRPVRRRRADALALARAAPARARPAPARASRVAAGRCWRGSTLSTCACSSLGGGDPTDVPLLLAQAVGWTLGLPIARALASPAALVALALVAAGLALRARRGDDSWLDC